MYRLICLKPAHLLSAQMALVSTFFQMFIVLGMYNFGFEIAKLTYTQSILPIYFADSDSPLTSAPLSFYEISRESNGILKCVTISNWTSAVHMYLLDKGDFTVDFFEN